MTIGNYGLFFALVQYILMVIRLIIFENNILKIYYYKTLLRIDSSEVIIYCKKYILKISGSKLKINYYEKEELHISGLIEDIKFDYV